MTSWLKACKWTLLGLLCNFVLIYSLFFAPGHHFLLGDRHNLGSELMGIALSIAVLAQIYVLFTLSKRRAR